MTQGLQNQIDRLYRRILMNVAPAKILATDDTGPIHRVQVNLNGSPEMIDQLAVMQHYGLNTHAPIGSDATAMFIAGQRSNAVIVATNNQKARLRNLQPGEVAVYTDEGDNLHFARQQAATLTAGNSFTATTKAATIKGTDTVTLDSPVSSVTDKLVLAHDPEAPLEACTKQYADALAIGGGGGQGPPGPQGPAGEAATIEVGTTTTGAAGTPAAVVNVGTPSAAIFDFTIPQGIQGVAGATGSPGAAASIAVGTTTTGAAGSAAAVVNVGSSSAAVFNFTIPQGIQGATGPQGPPGTSGAITGTSGGIPYFGSTGAMASSALLQSTAIVLGGGAGAAPATAADWTVPQANVLRGQFNANPAITSNLAGIQLNGLDGQSTGLQVDGYASTPQIFLRRADGTNAAKTGLVLNDSLGQIGVRGYNSAGAYTAASTAYITFTATETWSGTANGTQLAFVTTPTGGTAVATPLTLLSGIRVGNPTGGDLGVGTVNAQAGYYLNGANILGDWTFSPGLIQASNVTSNMIAWNTGGIAAPTMTTRSVGTKLVLYPSLSSTATDYAIGIQSGEMWFSGSGNYLWYAATTQIMGLTSAGALTVTSLSVTSHVIAQASVPAVVVYGTVDNAGFGMWEGNSSKLCFGTANSAGAPVATLMWMDATGIVYCSGLIPSGNINPASNNSAAVGSSGIAFNQMNSYNYFTASDRREKTEIEPLPSCLDLVQAIEPKSYRWVEGEDERTHWGFVAQEVGEAMAGHSFGGHVVDSEGGPQRLAYNELVATLWQAVRELTARVEALA